MIFSKDRRPSKIISLVDNNYDLNKYGISYWWLQEDSAIDSLISKINSYYDIGYRRFFLYFPTGNAPINSGTNSSSIWNPMEEWKKEDLKTTFKEFWKEKALLECSFGIMCGADIPNDYDLSTAELGLVTDIRDQGIFQNRKYHKPNINNVQDLIYIRDNFKEWINIGLKEIVFIDSSIGNSYSNILDINNIFGLRKIKVHANPFLIQESFYTDDNRSSLLPFVGFYKDYISIKEENKSVFSEKMNENSEISIIIESDDNLSKQQIFDLNNKNISIWTFDTDSYDSIIEDLITYKYSKNKIL